MAGFRAPSCQSCGDPIGYNPKAQATWERIHGAAAGEVPGSGWFHHAWSPKTDAQGNDIPGTGKYSMSKNDPNFHYAVPAADVTPESYLTAKSANDEQMRSHMKRHLSRQFDHLAAEQRGGKHIDLAED